MIQPSSGRWLYSGVLEAAAFSCLLAGEEPYWITGGFLHGIAALALLYEKPFPVHEPNRMVLLAVEVVCFFSLPAFGWGVALGVDRFGIRSRFRGVHRDYQEEIALLDSPDSILKEGLDRLLFRLRGKMDLQPLSELLDGSDFRLKRLVVERLGERPSPDSVRLLRKALHDSHPDIRFYAAGALSRMEGRVADEIREAELQSAKEESSATAQTYLGNRYYEYVYLGLLDPATRLYYLDRAIEAFRRAVQVDPAREDILLRLSRALVDRKSWPEALEILNRVLDRNPECAEALLYRAEVYLSLRQVESALRDCETIVARGPVPETVGETLSWLTRTTVSVSASNRS